MNSKLQQQKLAKVAQPTAHHAVQRVLAKSVVQAIIYLIPNAPTAQIPSTSQTLSQGLAIKSQINVKS